MVEIVENENERTFQTTYNITKTSSSDKGTYLQITIHPQGSHLLTTQPERRERRRGRRGRLQVLSVDGRILRQIDAQHCGSILRQLARQHAAATIGIVSESNTQLTKSTATATWRIQLGCRSSLDGSLVNFLMGNKITTLGMGVPSMPSRRWPSTRAVVVPSSLPHCVSAAVLGKRRPQQAHEEWPTEEEEDCKEERWSDTYSIR